MKKAFKYIYGPVPSWRLGASLGIDVFSCSRKVCNFDCLYCQLGRTAKFTNKPEAHAKLSEIVVELNSLPHLKVDYVTFSGCGESTLEKNLGKIIKAVKKLNIAPVAVLSNAVLINKAGVSKALSFADLVVLKLDAYSQRCLEKINRPHKGVRFEQIYRGIRKFRNSFKGKLALQMMFTQDNEGAAEKLAELARAINPDEVQINTPLRRCAIKPLSKVRIAKIKKYFKGLNIISVYDLSRKKVAPISKQQTKNRRGQL